MLCRNKTQIRTRHTAEWEQTAIRNLHQYTCKTTCIFYIVWKLRNFGFNNKSPSSVEFHPIPSSVSPLSLWNICHTCECNRKKCVVIFSMQEETKWLMYWRSCQCLTNGSWVIVDIVPWGWLIFCRVEKYDVCAHVGCSVASSHKL
jgi:hypothetical protein